MRDLAYQERAVEALEERVERLLREGGRRHKIVLKAPTGAGKTVICSELLSRLAHARDGGDDEGGRRPAFIWIAPNQLHLQSYRRLKECFAVTRRLRCVQLDELEHNGRVCLEPGTILFVNWQSVNGRNNVSRQPNERGDSFDEIVRRTRDMRGTPLMVVIDEAHLFGDPRSAAQSKEVLAMIDALVELSVSATPRDSGEWMYSIARGDVVEAQMIKRSIVVNPSLRGEGDGTTLRQHLLDVALGKLDELREAYRRLGAPINPLLLIQLPNDNKEVDADDTRMLRSIESWLEVRGVTRDNGQLQVWLSNDKTEAVTTNDIARGDHLSRALVFKQAIAQGWDCPRAAVLLIYRKITSFTFGVQTVGRIMRMPEQRHYAEPALNRGYVYTNLSHDFIQVEPESMDYITREVASLRPGISNVSLPTYMVSRGDHANRITLGSDFGRVLREAFDELVYAQHGSAHRISGDAPGSHCVVDAAADQARSREEATRCAGLNWEARQVIVTVVRDVELTGDRQTVHINKLLDYRLNARELDLTMDRWCAGIMGPAWDKRRSLANALTFLRDRLLGEYLGVGCLEAPVVVLSEENKGLWTAVMKLALERHQSALLARRLSRERLLRPSPVPWELPRERGYSATQYTEQSDTPLHALQPYFANNQQSTPEQRFERFLNEHAEAIEWWYKNGDQGDEHFRIPYPFDPPADARQSFFYPDYVLRLRNGQVMLFDTKTPESDSNAPDKHNALRRYIEELRNKQGDLAIDGGVIMEQNEVWWYPRHHIERTKDTEDWTPFLPTP